MEQGDIPLLTGSKHPPLLNRLSQWAEGVSQRNERAYLISTTALILFGYGILLTYPFMFVAGVFMLPTAIPAVLHMTDVVAPLLSLGFMLFGGVGCLALTRLPFNLPRGLVLDAQKLPLLFTEIDTLQHHADLGGVDRVVLNHRFEVELVRTPRFGLPILFTRSLVIGLPLMQSMRPIHFTGALARTFGRASRRHNRLLGAINQHRQLWWQYHRALRRAKTKPLIVPMHYLFQGYNALFQAFSLPAAKRDDLAANSYILEHLCADDTAELLEATAICDYLLQNDYWPRIRASVVASGTPVIPPHAMMAKFLRNAMNRPQTTQQLKQLYQIPPSSLLPQPTLKEHMDSLAIHRLRAVPLLLETAAHRFFDAMHGKVIEQMDEDWRQRTHPAQDEDSNTRIHRVWSKLREKARHVSLSEQELWRYARLTEKFQGKRAAVMLYKQIIQQQPKHAEAMYALGRILLDYRDDNGIRFLEKAMTLKVSLAAQGCKTIGKYFLAQGHTEKARMYEEKASVFEASHAA